MIVENQLERSDHDHLGKLITYKAVLDADVAIWIVADPRPEHVSAISLLNESTGEPYYLLKIEAVRIGDSEPAPLLTLITGPSEETIQAAAIRRDSAGRAQAFRSFWTAFLEEAGVQASLFRGLNPPLNPYLNKTAGVRGLSYNAWVRSDGAWVELRVDAGKDNPEDTAFWFERLVARQGEIEDAFGGPLEFFAPEDKRVRSIRWYSPISMELGDATTWSATIRSVLEAASRLEKAVRPVIKAISAERPGIGVNSDAPPPLD